MNLVVYKCNAWSPYQFYLNMQTLALDYHDVNV